MDYSVDRSGLVSWVCRRCENVKKGKCHRCGNPKESPNPRTFYCNTCRKLRDKQSKALSAERPLHKYKAKQWYQRAKKSDPEFKERRRKTRAEWIKKNPKKLRQYKLNAADRRYKKRFGVQTTE